MGYTNEHAALQCGTSEKGKQFDQNKNTETS
jgi:hypothetical protein